MAVAKRLCEKHGPPAHFLVADKTWIKYFFGIHLQACVFSCNPQIVHIFFWPWREVVIAEVVLFIYSAADLKWDPRRNKGPQFQEPNKVSDCHLTSRVDHHVEHATQFIGDNLASSSEPDGH